MKSPCVPGGFGVGSTAQVVPLRRSASVPAFVQLRGDEALGLAAAAVLMTGSGLPARPPVLPRSGSSLPPPMDHVDTTALTKRRLVTKH